MKQAVESTKKSRKRRLLHAPCPSHHYFPLISSSKTVRILRHTEMQYHLPPQINTPQVQLELPLERPLRAVVDKLKAMGPHSTCIL